LLLPPCRFAIFAGCHYGLRQITLIDAAAITAIAGFLSPHTPFHYYATLDYTAATLILRRLSPFSLILRWLRYFSFASLIISLILRFLGYYCFLPMTLRPFSC